MTIDFFQTKISPDKIFPRKIVLVICNGNMEHKITILYIRKHVLTQVEENLGSLTKL